MRVMVTSLLLLLSAEAVAAAPPAAFMARWADKEQKLEQLYADYWRTEYAIARGDSKLSSVEIQTRIREEETDPKFLSELKAAKLADPVLRRRRELLLDEAAVTRISSDSVLAKLVEEISRDEAAMRYNVAGKQMTRSELNNLLGHEPNRELRRQAWLAQQQLTLRTGERIRRAMAMRRKLAAKYSKRSFADLMLDHKGIRSRRRMLAWFEE